LKGARQIEAAHLRHLDIGHDDIGLERPRQVERGAAMGGAPNN
jgi:hypothetical protein